MNKLNKGFFASLRDSHPVNIGDVIEGHRVVMTAYTFVEGKLIPEIGFHDLPGRWTQDGNTLRQLS